MKHLPLLCPQLYEGTTMRVVGCNQCSAGWDPESQRCRIEMGCEHLPLVSPSERPECPMVDVCRHASQVAPEPCPVVARGMVCESALVRGGMPEWAAAESPISFHAMTVAS